MRRGRLLLAFAAAFTLATGVASADAHKRKVHRWTTVQFQELPGSGGDRLYGQVSIGAKPQEPFDGGGEPLLAHSAGVPGKCLAGQKVLIKHTLTAEGGGSDPPALIGTATTNVTGAWEYDSYEAAAGNQLLFDSFQVEVTKKRLAPKTHRHKHVCLGAFGGTTVFSY